MTFVLLQVQGKPLRELSKASEHVGKEDLGMSVPVRSNDEIGCLASNFNDMVRGLKDAEAAQIERGRIEGDLTLARSIQTDLLPAHTPTVGGLDIAFTCGLPMSWAVTSLAVWRSRVGTCGAS